MALFIYGEYLAPPGPLGGFAQKAIGETPPPEIPHLFTGRLQKRKLDGEYRGTILDTDGLYHVVDFHQGDTYLEVTALHEKTSQSVRYHFGWNDGSWVGSRLVIGNPGIEKTATAWCDMREIHDTLLDHLRFQ